MNQKSRVDNRVVQHPCHGTTIQIQAAQKLDFQQIFNGAAALAAMRVARLFLSQQMLPIPGCSLI
ncbi:hypothetical protein [Piscinibacter terrae]|uniref:hypothetical protein n=1 Tax=Piscinibacter terrae TaxID=2496871 RepID=UPI000F5A3D4D|nr:hypothetical protein [Albitalea terrae]